jgi:hypothetical protein
MSPSPVSAKRWSAAKMRIGGVAIQAADIGAGRLRRGNLPNTRFFWFFFK